MLAFSLALFLLTLLWTLGFRAKRGYDDKRVSLERTLCVPGATAGIWFGWVLVYDNRYSLVDDSDWNHPSLSTLGIHELWGLYLIVALLGGILVLTCILYLSDRAAEIGRALREGGPRRVSDYSLFHELKNRFHAALKEGDLEKATNLVAQFIDILPPDVQVEVRDRLAAQIRSELSRLLSGEGERPDVRWNPVGRLGVLLLPKIAEHPLIAEALRGRENHLAGQASSLQQTMDEFSGAHNAYTQNDEELKGITRQRKEIAQLLGTEAPEHDE